MSRTAAAAAVLGLSLVLGTAACDVGPGDPASARGGGQVASASGRSDANGGFGAYRGEVTAADQFRPGLPVIVDEPTAGAPAAVVVLVPGGGWSSADPVGLAPLARALARDGFSVVTITYGTSSTGEHYPVPADDVACGVAFAAQAHPGLPVVLVGHSAGAQLVALVGLVPHIGADPTCPAPPAEADAVVGLAGPYDIVQTGGVASALMGVDHADDPTLWDEADPLLQAGERPQVPFLLVHGKADPVVPVVFTTDFGAALRAGGHDVTVDLLPGVDHSTVYRAGVVGDLVADWITRTVVQPSG
ncbi:MAG TPA: alpha/beta fold hydrolase [Actinotalea sp.]